MKKICYVLSGIEYSGAEIVLERILQGNKYINSYFILLFKNVGIEKKLKKIYGDNKVYSLDIKYNKLLYSLTIPLLIWKVNKEIERYIYIIQPDLIYVNNTREGMLCSKVAERYSDKCIVHVHDMYESTNNPYAKLMIKRYLERYRKKITVSNATKESWNLKNMSVIYNGLDESYFEFNDKSGDIKNVAFVGSLTKRKGADKFIDSIGDIIKNLNLDIKIVYKYYDEQLKSNLSNLIEELKKNDSKTIQVLENLSPNEIRKLYKEIDLLIVPSVRDPLPTVIMEAQANGVIVIGNNVDGIPEMIPNKELITNLESSENIINSIEKILAYNEEKIRELRRKVFEYSKQNFSIDKNRQKLERVLEE